MRVLLRIESLTFADGAPRWWSDPARLGSVVAEVEGAGLGEGFRVAGQAGGRLEAVDGLGGVPALAAGWPGGLYRVASGEEPEAERVIDLDLSAGALGFRIDFGWEYARAHAGRLLDQMVALVVALHGRFADSALMGPRVQVEFLDMSYPRLRPPRPHLWFEGGTAVTVLSRRYHAESGVGAPPADVEKLLRAPMPNGVERVEQGDLVIFRWVRDLTDMEAVRGALTAQERWLAKVLEPPADSSFNAHGDYRVTPVMASPLPPLTVYDGFMGEGYKAVVTPGGGGLDDETVASIREWTTAGKLPDGTPLARLHLILPNRDAAVRVRGAAQEAGATGVYYADDSGALWDPFPPGEWAEP